MSDILRENIYCVGEGEEHLTTRKQDENSYCISKFVDSGCSCLNVPLATITFQNGPIKENGVNGCQNEDLIAIVIDRLQGFQAGEFACRENALAITKLEEALMWLDKRTANRIARGVEGLNIK